MTADQGQWAMVIPNQSTEAALLLITVRGDGDAVPVCSARESHEPWRRQQVMLAATAASAGDGSTLEQLTVHDSKRMVQPCSSGSTVTDTVRTGSAVHVNILSSPT